jgi:hypothetical protein
LSRAEESDRLDRSSRKDGFARRQEFDQSRSSIGDGFDKRLSRAKESDRLDRSSRKDGCVRRQEVDQSRSSVGDGFDKRLSRAEESDQLDQSSRRDRFVQRQEFDQSRSSRGDELDNKLSRKVLGALAELVWNAATAAALAPSPTRLEFGSDVANVTRQNVVINDHVTNCFDDELDFPDVFDEPDWSAGVAPPYPGRSEFGSDPVTVTRQIGTVNNLAIDAARFVSPLCCVLHEDISQANPWIIYR